ncbi:MAG: biopolymer transporter ExbD [Bacteroidota bacterium]|nr:biopolymer transporter ExbD [Bacteroidota bacterium]
MAELNMQAGTSRGRSKRRSKKLSTRIDLTPMVDLGFLLITFFFVTTTWAKPRAMAFNLPADGPSTLVGKNAALSVLACGDNKLFYYHGDLGEALKAGACGITGYGAGGLRTVIRNKQEAMDRSYKGGRTEMTLLIKATPQASVRNIVSLLDEMRISGVAKYALVDLSEEEKELVAAKKL